MPSQLHGENRGGGVLSLGSTPLRSGTHLGGGTCQPIAGSLACLWSSEKKGLVRGRLLQEGLEQAHPRASARIKSSKSVGSWWGRGSVGAEAAPGSREAFPRGAPSSCWHLCQVRAKPASPEASVEFLCIVFAKMVFRLLVIILLQKKG